MPVFLGQLGILAANVLMGMVGKVVTASVIETLVLAGVKALVKKSSSPVDDQIYKEVYKAIKGQEDPNP
jgi:hypothetical protein